VQFLLAQKLHEDARWTSISSRTLLNTNHLMVSVELKKICSCMTLVIQPSLVQTFQEQALGTFLLVMTVKVHIILLKNLSLKKPRFRGTNRKARMSCRYDFFK